MQARLVRRPVSKAAEILSTKWPIRRLDTSHLFVPCTSTVYFKVRGQDAIRTLVQGLLGLEGGGAGTFQEFRGERSD